MPNGPLPYLSADCPGIGGTLKTRPEDFIVEEIPAYEPTGAGEHLFLWLEKRGVSAEELKRRLSKTLEIAPDDIGMAGLKDRQAVTRQYVSVPAVCEERVALVDDDQIRVLRHSRHPHKLKTGHLKGNRFSILLRDPHPQAFTTAGEVRDLLAKSGFPNYFGDQRFGREGVTRKTGFQLLRGDLEEKQIPRSRRRFLKRLSLSAAQAELFNQALAKRMTEGQVGQVFPGDVMQVSASGGLFVAEDIDTEQKRFEAGEIAITGPIFGRKMRQPTGEPAAWEEQILKENKLSTSDFRRFPKLTPGTRRPYLIRPGEFAVSEAAEGLRFDFTLPAGVYATTLLREFQKNDESASS